MDITTLKHRNEFGAWLEANNVTGVGVEVGSLCGDYAREIKKHWSGTLVMLDPWERQPDDVYREPTNHSDWNSAYKSCQAIAAMYPDKVYLHKAYSPEASKEYRDGELAWVYIDSRHDLEAITADLNAWWPKVRSGGVLCGHDMRYEISDTQQCEVKPAVEKFIKEHGLSIHITNAPGCGSFWIIKP